MSAHAMEEMVEDGLDIDDIEQAILNGCITRIEKVIQEELNMLWKELAQMG